MTNKAQCGDCGVFEGEIHEYGCDMEVCPFCGGQLLMCATKRECSKPLVWRSRVPVLYPKAGKTSVSRVPFILYPVMCAKCGQLWPEFFNVPDDEWKHYIQPDKRHEVLCHKCYAQIKAMIGVADY